MLFKIKSKKLFSINKLFGLKSNTSININPIYFSLESRCKMTEKEKKKMRKRKKRKMNRYGTPPIPMNELYKRKPERRELEDNEAFISTMEGQKLDGETADRLEQGYNPGFGLSKDEMDEMLKDIPHEKIVEDIPKEEDLKFYQSYLQSNIPDRMKLLEFDKKDILFPKGKYKINSIKYDSFSKCGWFF